MSLPQQNPDTSVLARLAALERQVQAMGSSTTLANAAIQAYLGVQGSGRGIKVLDSTGAERVRLGISEAGNYGLTVNDGTRDRVQTGQITGGGYGMEVHDASGNLIWDTTGLYGNAVMQRLGGEATGGSFASPVVTSTANTTAWQTVSGSSTGVGTLNRGGVIFFSAMANYNKMTGATTTDYFLRIAIVDHTGSLLYSSPVPGVVDPSVNCQTITISDMISVAAGTFDVRLQVSAAAALAGTAAPIAGFVVDAFQMGT